MPTTDEVRETGRLVGDALSTFVRSIGHTHLSISTRAFDAIGPIAEPVRAVHDGLARATYATVAGAHAGVARVGAEAAIRRDRSSSTGTEDHPAEGRSQHRVGDRAVAIVNGLKGDLVAERYPALAVPMAVRDQRNDRDVDLTAAGVSAAFPEASGRLVVFVHGWCLSDRQWRCDADEDDDDGDSDSVEFGPRLQEDLGITPVFIRYNSGLAVADNGTNLAELLHQLVRIWPVPVAQVDLIGYSMGGLVVRSACHSASTDDRPWADLVRHVVCVGTPHFGAPLARAVHHLVPILDRLPETRPLSTFLHRRSRGVKDLRHGLLAAADEHPETLDADEYHGDESAEFVARRRREVPFLPEVTYSFVGATVTSDRRHPLGRFMGDLIVSYPSASGSSRQRSIPFELEHGTHVGGVSHFGLVKDPTVYEHLRDRLGSSPVDPARADVRGRGGEREALSTRGGPPGSRRRR